MANNMVTSNPQAIGNNRGRAPRRSSNSYGAEEWLSHRAIITQMYYYEGKTLNEVRAHLKQEFNFRPTERMYKSRLHAWGLDKKKKEHEMLDLVRQGLSQDGNDKDKVFLVRGREVTLAEALHYFSRKGIKDPAVLLDLSANGANISEMMASSPEDAGAATPESCQGDTNAPISESDYDMPPSPEDVLNADGTPMNRIKTSDIAQKQLSLLCRQLSIAKLEPLPPFRNVSVESSIQKSNPSALERRYLDAIIVQAQTHYQQLFQAREISLSNTGQATWTATSDEALADQFYYSMYHGYSYLWNDQRQVASEHFDTAFGMIERLIVEGHVGFLIYLFDLVIRHDGTGYEEPMLMMLQQVARVAERLYKNPNHPIFLIASWLHSAPSEISRSWISLSALRKLLDFFQDAIGYFHGETIALLQTFATGLLNKKIYAEAAIRFQQLVDAFTLTQNPNSYEVCYALRATSEAYFHNNQLKESLQALKMALAQSAGIPRAEEREIHVRCLRAMAEISNKIGEKEDALRTMQHVVDTCADTFGPDHTFTKRARMHQKSLRVGENTTDAALPPMVYRLGRGGNAAKYVWTTRSSPTRLQA